MKPNRARTPAILGVLVMLLAIALAAVALQREADALLIGLDLLLFATSMELFRRAHPPAP